MTAIEQVGFFDEEFALYCEEIDWAARFKEAGWKNLCAPAAHIIHHEGKSTSQVRVESFVKLWTSRYRLHTKHPQFAPLWLARRIVIAGMKRKMRDASPEMKAACEKIIRSLEGQSMTMTKLAAIVLTKNEEQHIGACLDSLAWADRRVVFDSFSTDRTCEIAREHGAEVMQHPFSDYASQRNAALQAVEAEWIFFVDADERATPELAEEITTISG